MKTLVCGLIAAGALTGCVAVPAYPDATYYPEPAYYPAPAASVYVAPPTIYFGGSYYRDGHRGYRGHGGHRGRHWR